MIAGLTGRLKGGPASPPAPTVFFAPVQAPGVRGAGCPAPLRSRLFLPLTAPSVQRTPRRASRPSVRSNIPRLPFCVNRSSAFFEKKFLFFALFFHRGKRFRGRPGTTGKALILQLSASGFPVPARQTICCVSWFCKNMDFASKWRQTKRGITEMQKGDTTWKV